MIKVIGNKGSTVYYECECGVKGKCMLKPLSEDKAMITDIRCPICLAVERIKLQPSESDDDELYENLEKI